MQQFMDNNLWNIFSFNFCEINCKRHFKITNYNDGFVKSHWHCNFLPEYIRDYTSLHFHFANNLLVINGNTKHWRKLKL